MDAETRRYVDEKNAATQKWTLEKIAALQKLLEQIRKAVR